VPLRVREFSERFQAGIPWEAFMSWAIALAAVGAAAGVFNAVDEATSNRSIRDSLDKVINYLGILEGKIDAISQQNARILKQLDELPEKIRAIVQEVVDNALVEREYSTLHSIHLNITRLRLDEDYRITKPGWKTLAGSLTYVFQHENRLSNMFKLIRYCELALAATRNRARPFIISLLTDKIALVKLLRNELILRAEMVLAATVLLLNRGEYIASHNLSEQLGSLDNFTYVRQPDRNRTVEYFEEVCRYRNGHCGEVYEVCHQERRSRQEPDTPFHNARDEFCRQIDAKIDLIKGQLPYIVYVTGILLRLENYLGKVDLFRIQSDTSHMFYAPILKKGAKLPATLDILAMDEEEDKAYNEYFDDIDTVVIEGRPELLIIREDGVFASISRRCVD
jgi:hypothetical protein